MRESTTPRHLGSPPLPIRETLIREVFPRLRKLGIMARSNFLCCGGCASAELHQHMLTRPKLLGAVFWHKQDDERLRKGGPLFLNFGARERVPKNERVQERATILIGWTVVGLAREAGLDPKWDGSPNQRIQFGERK